MLPFRGNSPESEQDSSRSVSPDQSPEGPSLEEERANLIKRNLEKLSSIGITSLLPLNKAAEHSTRRRVHIARSAPAQPIRRSDRIAAMPLMEKRVGPGGADREKNKRARSGGEGPAAVEAAIEVDRNRSFESLNVQADPYAYLQTFSDTQKEYAVANNLDLTSEAGRILAAVLRWPSQFRLCASNECTFARAYLVCAVLHDVGGLSGDDFTDPRRQAAVSFDDEMKDLLKGGPSPLKLLEIQRLSSGLANLCGAGGSGVKKPKRSGNHGGRSSTTLTDRILQDFEEDFVANGSFANIDEVSPRLRKIVADFGGLDAVALLLGGKKQKGKICEATLHEKLRHTTYNKWRNLRYRKVGAPDTPGKDMEQRVETHVEADAVEGQLQVHAGGGSGPSGGPEDDEAHAGKEVPCNNVVYNINDGMEGPSGLWQVLLDSDQKELDRYNAAGGHQAYLEGCSITGKTKGCFLVGTFKEKQTKPEALGAGLVVGGEVKPDTDGFITVVVIGRVHGLNNNTTVYMPPSGKSFSLKERPLSLFQKVRWPLMGVLAVKENKSAVQWAMKTTGLGKKQLDTVELE